MNKKRLQTLFILLFIAQGLVPGQLRLPSIFGDHMVLQQDSKVAIWGWSASDDPVTVVPSWDGTGHSAQPDRNGRWQLYLETPVAGGPFSLTVSAGDGKTEMKDVMTGEVWICSGQSNMEMPMKGYLGQPVMNSTMDILNSANDGIRLITVPRKGSSEATEDFDGDWVTASPATVAGFSATAWYFGRLLHEVLGVPVGLIHDSYGGSCVQAWMSRDIARPFGDIPVPARGDSISGAPNLTPTGLFYGMLHPVIGYGIRGCIWYQGETNRLEPEAYEEMFPAMVAEWRSLWGQGDFPFYFAQIAPYDYSRPGEQDVFCSAYIREAQLNCTREIPNSGMAVLMDCGEKDCIHPSDKAKAGDRLAFLALSGTYGIGGIECQSPVFREMKVEGAKATLYFDHVENGLTTFGGKADKFEVAGADKVFYPAQAVVKRRTVTLTSPKVKQPVAARYAFRDFVKGCLFGTNGLPVSSFRTDNW